MFSHKGARVMGKRQTNDKLAAHRRRARRSQTASMIATATIRAVGAVREATAK